jgi:hypothetical protein
MTENKDNMLTKTAIKEWFEVNDGWIQRLGEPDKVVKMRGGRQAHLYLTDRVNAFFAAHQDELEAYHEKRKKRSTAARKGMETRLKKLIDFAETVDLELDLSELPEKLSWLKNETINNFHDLQQWRLAYANNPSLEYAERLEDQAANFKLTPKAIIAYVRHCYTDYDPILEEIRGKPGTARAYDTIRRRVDDAILQELRRRYSEFRTVGQHNDRERIENPL